jgi:predicted transposase/invertase (TIGR01784 family)
MTAPTTPNPHDRFFKASWSRPEVARGFLAHYLPTDVQAVLDLNTLTLSKASFVDATLKAHYSDLLYQVKRKQGQDAYVYLLMEHKSYPDRWTVFQLLRHIVRIWERAQEKSPARLPAIVPLVVYHGEQGWDVQWNLCALVDADDALSAFVPDFRYLVCDLSHDDLSKLQGQATLQVAVRLLKYILHREFAERLPEIAAFFQKVLTQPDGLGYLETVLKYIAQSTDKLDDTTLQTVVQRALPELGDTLMPTIAETWEKRGLEKGLERGLERGLEKGLERGRQEEIGRAHGNILTILELRFGTVPRALSKRINALDDVATLTNLLTQAATVNSLEAFQKQVLHK